jgi:hypothetical protein|tara:strand:- start:199 stop:705 length:507 start_codon:yes stop_codon:yes gene_type:complete
MLINNFLDDETFEDIYKIITSNDMPWYTQAGATKEGDGQVLFTHVLINEQQQVNSGLFETIGRPIVKKIKSIEPDFFRMIRMKINCLPNQFKPIKSGYHTDLPASSNYKTLILSLNTNNGYTEFKDKKMPNFKSIKNSACIFDGSKEHRSVSQTDAAYRWNINFNYEI